MSKGVLNKLLVKYSLQSGYVGDTFPLTTTNMTHFLHVPTHPFEEL